jgi:sigma-B regulation protein RsbU (phosphoserine phosphatase)
MEIAKPLVLIVDDNPTNIDLLVNTLKMDYRLGIAKNGPKALEYAEKHMPDLILLDIMMPGMNGYEVCTRLKATAKTKDIPVIFITAMSEGGHKTRGFDVGALDYVTKPFHAAEVKARVKTHLSLKKARDQEIFIASKIQKTLLLGQPPQNIQGIQIAHLSAASQKVDGDFYDFFKHSNQCFDIVVGDVMGKGIPAALLGAALKSHLLRVLNELRLSTPAEKPLAPAQIVSSVHAHMIDQLVDLETFVTLCYARFDMAKYLFSFVDCGHMRTIHYHDDTNRCDLLQGINMPLGFPEKEPFRQTAVDFNPGDLFVFYSDGLTESRDQDGNLYGENRLVDVVRRNANIEPKRLITQIWDDIIAFSESETFDDDVTCVLVKINQQASRAVFMKEDRLDIMSDLKELGKVRSFIHEFCAQTDDFVLDDNRRDLFKLAATEVTANIIKHSYKGHAGQPIQVKAKMTLDEVVIEFFDWGEGFDPKSVAAPVFNGSRDNGFGIHIIAHTVDEVIYSRQDQGKNCACLKIKLSGGN